uniref:hypothetical protein n=1 Tax=Pseudodesulfovibrio profundus TaxID=57320 RepID=UPI001E50BD5B|nr:hypothetical protein [Pseudodesulfovibrio profundus]
MDQTLRIELKVVLHTINLELAAVLGMGGPRPEQNHRLILSGEQVARELNLFPGWGD